MKLGKHSYILTKQGFLLCVLLNTRTHYAGEILYGQVPLENCPIKNIEGSAYYKYWSLQSGNRKIFGKSGEQTSYRYYYDAVSRLYPQFTYNHPLAGFLFKADKQDVCRVWEPIPFAKLVDEPRRLVDKLSNLLQISARYIDVGGSNMLDTEHIVKTDFDIIINSKKASKEMVKNIRKLTGDPSYWEKSSNGHIHHRRFVFNSVNICPFGSSKDDDLFESSSFVQAINKQEIEAQVLDDSESLLSPARYLISVGNKKMNLLSYYVAHTALLKKGDRLKLEASKYRFNINSKSVFAFVIPTEGTWIEFI